MSSQHHDSPTEQRSSSQGDSPTDARNSAGVGGTSQPESQRVSAVPSPISREPTTTSEREEGYPSWLPKRPPPPVPASPFTSIGRPTPIDPEMARGDTPEPFTYVGGRKATPRSVRIVGMQSGDRGSRREPTDQTRVSIPLQHQHARAWSKATSAGMSPTLFSSSGNLLSLQVPRPRFRASGLHLELLRNPSWRSRIHFYLFPLFVFYDIPLQTFFDFNAVFILVEVAKFPNPVAPGVPGSGRNWALGAAAYIACWLAWILVVFVIYQLLYSFYRRWRVKRPLILPLYMSSSAFNFVCMTSYANFSFFQHLRTGAFLSEQQGSLRDGLAETCYFYSQNLSVIALLLPRAGLCLALLFAFWTIQPDTLSLADMGVSSRDATFFRSDGSLTDYARGVLIANAAWTAWRLIVLLLSWFGLWLFSGQACAGLCGPRYRWEEDDAEKNLSVYSDGDPDADALPWNWRESTRLRVQEAYDFCMTSRAPPARWRTAGGDKKETSEAAEQATEPPFQGMDKVLAAIGLPTAGHHQAPKRRMLSEDLFEEPEISEVPKDHELPQVRESPSPPVTRDKGKGRAIEPEEDVTQTPYPFAGPQAQLSSEDQPRVPFPPSPSPPEIEEGMEAEEEEEEEESGEPEMEGTIDEGTGEGSQVTSQQGRSSASMSSLGQPVTSRYPFQFRRPGRGQAPSLSSSLATHHTPQSQSPSTESGSSPRTEHSRSTHGSRSTGSRSTGNRESSNGSEPRSFMHSSPSVSGIPHPPRRSGAGRRRAGTVPSVPSSPSPITFSNIARGEESDNTHSSRPPVLAHHRLQGHLPEAYESSEDEGERPGELGELIPELPEAEGAQEEAEQEDSVGLLSSDGSPRSSLGALRHRGSGVSLGRRRNRSRSRSRTSSSRSARSRAQSLIQSIHNASRSSVELVHGMRSRTSSMARLEDPSSPSDRSRTGSDPAYVSDRSRSGSGPATSEVVGGSGSSNENHTFGVGRPMRSQLEAGVSDQEQPHQNGMSMEVLDRPSASHPRTTSHVSQRTILSSQSGSPYLSPPPGSQAGPSVSGSGSRRRAQSASLPRRPSEENQPEGSVAAAQSFATEPSGTSSGPETSAQARRDRGSPS